MKYIADLKITDVYHRQVCLIYRETTNATSVKKALSNFNYRAKKKLGLVNYTKLVCNGVIMQDDISYEVKNNKVVEVEYSIVKPVYKGNVIEVDGKEYIFDEEDNVFWLNGIKYSEYITREA